MRFGDRLYQDEDEVFVAEAVRNVSEATAGYLLSLKQHGESIAPPLDEEVAGIAS
jgi:predicted RNase H-like HicB family nuclease